MNELLKGINYSIGKDSNDIMVIRCIIENRNRDLTEKKILKLNKLLLKGLNSKYDKAGYREDKVKVNNLLGKYTDEKLKIKKIFRFWLKSYNYFLSRCRNKGEILKVIVYFHISFEHIHPFNEGNGRIGRVIIYHTCLRYRINPIIILKREYEEYLEMVDKRKYSRLFDLFRRKIEEKKEILKKL